MDIYPLIYNKSTYLTPQSFLILKEFLARLTEKSDETNNLTHKIKIFPSLRVILYWVHFIIN